MNFIHYYKLIKESIDFSDLPKYPPYGFWIFPDGRYEITRSGHKASAKGIINQYYKEQYKSEDLYNFLFMLGFIRVVTDTDTLLYESKLNSHKAIKTVKDIAQYYKLDLISVK